MLISPNRRRWYQASFILVLLATICGRSMAQEPPPAPTFSLSSTAFRDELLLGDPLFLKIALSNQSDQAHRLRDLPKEGCLSQLPWRIEVSEENGKFEEVPLARVDHVRERPENPVEIRPEQELTDYLVVWFAAGGDVPEERRLVFRKTGDYRYRIAFAIVLSDGRATQMVATEGRVAVQGRVRGSSEMIRGLREIIDSNANVAYKHVGRLDTLLTQLKGSHYAAYVRWLRIRSYLADGANEKGNDVLETRGDPPEAKVLASLSDDLLAQKETLAPPMVRDAMITKGILAARRKDKTEARRIYDQVVAEFGYSDSLKKLQMWAN